MNTDKINTSAIYEMFETINRKLDKRPDKPIEPMQIDLAAVNTIVERLEYATDEIRKPQKVEHRHTISIASNWFFFSWILLAVIIFGLFWTMANQRQTIGQYKENDLKYRYIKMQGQTDEEGIYRLEQQFQYSDSIKIIRKQVEKYEELVKIQAQKIERVKLDSAEVELIRNEAELIKNRK
jgi:hypothetical protein